MISDSDSCCKESEQDKGTENQKDRSAVLEMLAGMASFWS